MFGEIFYKTTKNAVTILSLYIIHLCIVQYLTTNLIEHFISISPETFPDFTGEEYSKVVETLRDILDKRHKDIEILNHTQLHTLQSQVVRYLISKKFLRVLRFEKDRIQSFKFLALLTRGNFAQILDAYIQELLAKAPQN